MSVDKLDKLRYRLLVVEALRAAKTRYSYRELSRMIGMDSTVLARYVTASVIPSYDQAVRLWRILRRVFDPAKLILESASMYGGLLDLTPALSDPLTLKIITLEFLERFRHSGITKILVPEAAGIPLATALSLAFNVNLVIARRAKENPLLEYIEEHIVETPRVTRIFYIPKGSLGRGDNVLVVDDIIQSGYTLAVMRKLIERSGARLAGVAALVVVGEEWKSKSGVDRIEAIINLSKHP